MFYKQTPVKITGYGLSAGCQVFYRKIYGFFTVWGEGAGRGRGAQNVKAKPMSISDENKFDIGCLIVCLLICVCLSKNLSIHEWRLSIRLFMNLLKFAAQF